MNKAITGFILFLAFHCSIVRADFNKGMEFVQQARWYDAEQEFRPEAEAGNADAMYWLGRSLEFQDYQKGLTAGEWFYKSAELGNPWAMYSLQDDTNCDFFGWPCDRMNWKDKQIEIWREKAAKGDGLAEYALASYDLGWKGYIPVVRKKERNRRLTKALEFGASYAAITLNTELIDGRGYKTAPKKVREEGLKYLKIAANQSYAPAMTDIVDYSDLLDEGESKVWLYKALTLGYPSAPYLLIYAYDEGEYGFAKDKEQAYYFSKVLSGWGGKFAREDYYSNDDGKIGENLTREKKIELDKKAEEWLATHTVNHFYNEVNLF
ncbi:sel1 repeat family protein [Photobacterium lipolyticum]|uniref:Sel1 repeat family protein n=1 Tax=Photobacterium lipolyticum TaxID=266810 RepID=A0A2T3N1B9_9GAMM|nr:sel1 repeat family protein [Photobacterium lipolyticum]PSW06096.1 hypothetical protein C9I89_06185 [Photobacterium lipolyticum]